MTFLTTRQVAQMLQTSSDMVERLIRQGQIKAERLTPRGRYRIKEDSVKEYARQQGLTLLQK
jgi:excisionase family DNA binding protein